MKQALPKNLNSMPSLTVLIRQGSPPWDAAMQRAVLEPKPSEKRSKDALASCDAEGGTLIKRLVLSLPAKQWSVMPTNAKTGSDQLRNVKCQPRQPSSDTFPL